ncbi:JmjC domain-containing protein [Acanthopleuribacter pedis]|uniref:JmjC domain-containing protein n=1 Tax=Acanthopleuribacter pedis TaxID=442870 RepID=A0A8J7Q4A2_9BACT|nr:cupin domain-containing protein [Acanthopleuribacter pedis]MBO1318930.1 hypothetical protein [Acanthopleuribacter pedis]
MSTQVTVNRFSAMVAPTELDAFLNDVWPYQSHFSQAVEPPMQELMTLPGLQSIEGLVAIPRRAKCRIHYTHEKGRNPETNVPHDEMVRAFNASQATIYVQQLQEPTIRAWCQDVDAALKITPGTARVNAFTSPPGRGLGWHWDDHEIFIIQVRGTKRWYLAPEDWPRGKGLTAEGDDLILTHENGEQARRDIGECRIFDLTPGSVLFVPSDVWHTTETKEESLHLVMNVGRNVPMN